MDSPIESLLSDHLTIGISAAVVNLRTWLALLTAAVSFWRIRTSSAGNAISISNCQINSTPEPEIQFQRKLPPLPAALSPVIQEDDVGVTKGKFLVYFEDDGERDSEVESGSEEWPVVGKWECDGGNGKLGESTAFGFEGVMKMRMEDLGWYRYQDLMVISGNVVRLWDGVPI